MRIAAKSPPGCAPPYFYLAQSIPRSFQAIINTASGSQINSYLVRSYISKGESLPKASEPIHFEGGISLGNPGCYRNVIKFDVSSLYPNIILQYQVYNADKDPERNFLKMIEGFTAERLRNKALYKETGEPKYKALSDAQKIIINSGYGFLGAPGLIFNSPVHAAFITEKGREILTTAMNWCKEKGFTLVNADTDSIAFCKADQSAVNDGERAQLLGQLNALYPALIQFEDDGYYDALYVNKAKNYALRQGTKITIKGSALKATSKEPALRECLSKVIESTLVDHATDIESIASQYSLEIENLTDIRRWASKKTITAKVLKHARTQEARIFAAIEGTDYREGDKVYVYFKSDGNLKLAEHWSGDHDKARLHKKLKLTIQVLKGKSK